MVTSACVDSTVEIPLFEFDSMNFNDKDKSSNPKFMMRQLEYLSTASSSELLAFYENNEYTKHCKYNESADNYLCDLAEVGKVKSGMIAIPSKSKGDRTKVFANYFYYK